jgi:polyisoprenoid-binding protein YceI
MLKIILLLIPMSWGAVQQVDLAKQTSEVEFFAVGKPSFLKINGTGGKLNGTLELDKNKVKGRFLVKMDAFTTGVSLRDQHMKEKYLETGKYAEAWLEIENIDLPVDFLKTKKVYSNVPFQGKLSLHGVEKSVKGTAEVDTGKESPSVETEFKVLVSDYQIAVPTYMGIKVADEVTVKARMNLNLVKE